MLGLVLLRADAPTGGRLSSAAGGAARIARRTRSGARPKEAAEEKELLEALGRRGELTVAAAALETSLSVGEADRVLSGLASRGHLKVRAEHGGLFYSLWEGDG